MKRNTSHTQQWKEHTLDFYNNLLDRFPDKEHQALHYQSGESQVLRYIILSQIAELQGKTVLDFGCGFGSLGYFFQKQKVGCRYTGIDINPNMIQQGLQKYKSMDLRCVAMKKELFEKDSFDYTFASGVFNLNQGTEKWNYEYLFEHIDMMYHWSKFGIAFNIATEALNDSNVATLDPHFVFQKCKAWSNTITLKQDYLKHDATIYLLKQ